MQEVWQARELAALTRRIAATCGRWNGLLASLLIGMWGGFFILVVGEYPRLDVMVFAGILTVGGVVMVSSRFIQIDQSISLEFRAALYDMRAEELSARKGGWEGEA